MQQQHQQPEQEHFVNSTCRNVGHIWENTTSHTIRRCTSNHCRAIQRLINGTWVTIPHPSSNPVARPVKRQAVVPHQISLF